VLGLWSVAFIVLVAGERDHRGIAAQMDEQRECVAEVVDYGAPAWMALRECSVRLNVPVRTIEENLP
jgi:hypothetical protein